MPKMGSLADALFSGTLQKVLALLFGHPDRSFFAREVIKATGSGSGAVQRELSGLEESGLVTTRRVGNQKHYQANRNAPIFDELHRIVVKTIGVAEPLRAALKPLAKRVRLALIYGSIAKSTDRAGSDIDLLVVTNDVPMEELFKRLGPVERQLGRKVSPTVYTEAEFEARRARRAPFLQRVLDGETIILIGSKDAAGTA